MSTIKPLVFTQRPPMKGGHIQRVADAPVAAPPFKGRGTPWQVEHRYRNDTRETHDDGWGTLDQEALEDVLPPCTSVTQEHARSIISTNDSPDIPFEASINPYRGCEHGCIYCFARPTHSYLNLSPGLDFETRIFAKMNAAERLREALRRPGYRPCYFSLGAATDAYQPVERRLRITRSIIEVLSECHHPFSVVTKSAGVERDIDLIAPMAERNLVAIYLSVTTLDPTLSRILEPRAASPQRRLQAIERLAKAGIPVGVSMSPLIPFINEPEIEQVLTAARDAGARSAFAVVLRLPWEVNPLFQHWLEQHFPERAGRVMARIRDMRGGKDYRADFKTRLTGEGVWADLLAQRVAKARSRLGLDHDRVKLDTTQFRPPAPRAPTEQLRSTDGGQASLF